MFFGKQEGPLLASLTRIWDRAPSNAFTDLIRFNNSWFCCFRESDRHVKGRNGIIRILQSSDDTVSWSSIALIEEEGVDLRDPKLSITPDGQLMLLLGGSVFSKDNSYISRQPCVSFSPDGKNWSPLIKILNPGEWLWRVTWHQGIAYGVSYRYTNPQQGREEWEVGLYQSPNGIHYSHIIDWDIKGYPNETTLQFLPTGESIALLRRDKPFDNFAWIGVSRPPYTNWKWISGGRYFGGPNFIITEEGTMWAAGRLIAYTPYGLMEKTALVTIDFDGIRPALILPSGGDCSYPGLVYHQGFLWISYYSSHEGKAAIYLAKVLLNK